MASPLIYLSIIATILLSLTKCSPQEACPRAKRNEGARALSRLIPDLTLRSAQFIVEYQAHIGSRFRAQHEKQPEPQARANFTNWARLQAVELRRMRNTWTQHYRRLEPVHLLLRFDLVWNLFSHCDALTVLIERSIERFEALQGQDAENFQVKDAQSIDATVKQLDRSFHQVKWQNESGADWIERFQNAWQQFECEPNNLNNSNWLTTTLHRIRSAIPGLQQQTWHLIKLESPRNQSEYIQVQVELRLLELAMRLANVHQLTEDYLRTMKHRVRPIAGDDRCAQGRLVPLALKIDRNRGVLQKMLVTILWNFVQYKPGKARVEAGRSVNETLMEGIRRLQKIRSNLVAILGEVRMDDLHDRYHLTVSHQRLNALLELHRRVQTRLSSYIHKPLTHFLPPASIDALPLENSIDNVRKNFEASLRTAAHECQLSTEALEAEWRHFRHSIDLKSTLRTLKQEALDSKGRIAKLTSSCGKQFPSLDEGKFLRPETELALISEEYIYGGLANLFNDYVF